MQSLVVTVDGSCRRKRMGVGVLVRDADTNEVLRTVSKGVGWGTSCRAEWHALLTACALIDESFQGTSVIVYTDSQLVYRQLSGEYQVRDKHLKPMYRKAVERLKKLKARVRWHRRDEGDGPLADELANKGGWRGSNNRVSVVKGGHRGDAPGEDARGGIENYPTKEEGGGPGQDVCMAQERGDQSSCSCGD